MSVKREPLDWVLFVALTFLWAVAYPCTKLAVNAADPAHGFPPQLVIALRLTLGAAILLTTAIVTGQKFPVLRDWRRWSVISALGFLGMTAPFFVITTAQKTVDSSVAALYIAATPLFVASLAHFFFADERMSWKLGLGLLVGFAGIGVLFGPDAISNFGSASVWAQILLLLGTLFYAVTTIIARAAPPMPPLVLSAGFVSLAAVFSWFGLPSVDFAALAPAPSAWFGVIGLGIFPTALSSLLYMQLVARTSATFLSLTGYTIPVISAIIGYVAFGEVQGWDAMLAFGLILSGVWISQHSGTKPSISEPVPEDV